MKDISNNYEEISYVVSRETGEITESIYPGDRIIHKTEEEKKLEEYKATHEIDFNEEVGFVKMFTDITYALSLTLPPREFQIAYGLSKFVSFESCILQNGYGNQCHNMTLKEIAQEMKIDYTRMSRIMNSLIKKGIIGEFSTGNLNTKKTTKSYIANPCIYIKGRNPSKDVLSYFFNHTGWKEFLEECFYNADN